jgi:O-antigen/teichoic acid export membrane protein
MCSGQKSGGYGVSRAKKNVLSNWLAFLVTALVNFFLLPYVVNRLGDTQYGIWILIMSLTGYLGLLDIGVRNAVTRYVAAFHAAGDHARAGRVVSSSLLIFAGSGLAATGVAVLVAAFGIGFFRITPEYQTAARIVLILAGVNVAVTLLSGVFGGVLIGLQQFTVANAIQILGTVLRAFGFVAVLYRGEGLVALVLVQLVFSVLVLAANARSSFREYPQLEVGGKQWDRDHLSLLFSFSLYSFLLDMSLRLSFHTDSVVIGLFLPVGMITFFAIAGNLVNYSREFISGIAYAVLPMTSALQAEGKTREVQRVTLKGAKYASMVVLPVALCFMLRGETFVGLWMGPRYAALSGHVLLVLSLALVFMAANQVGAATLRGINRHKSLVPIYVGEALCNLLLSIALVRPFGVVGVAWSTTVPSLLVSFLFWPWFLRRTLDIPLRSYASSAWIWPGLAAVPYALALYAIERFWVPASLLVFFLQVILVLPLIGLCYWYLCFTPEEREEYERKFIPRMFKAPGKI